MPGNLQLYSILLSVVGGNLLAEEQEIDFSRTANAQQVDTVLKGFAGMSPGSPMLEVDIHGAMPQGGFEFDAGPYIISLTPVAVQVIGPGGKAMKGDAFIVSDQGRHGVNQQARYSFRCLMPMQLFK
jgi:hypothetical protein